MEFKEYQKKQQQQQKKNRGEAKFFGRQKPQESEAWQEYYKVKSIKKSRYNLKTCKLFLSYMQRAH